MTNEREFLMDELATVAAKLEANAGDADSLLQRRSELIGKARCSDCSWQWIAEAAGVSVRRAMKILEDAKPKRQKRGV